jgi:hypothetical protein
VIHVRLARNASLDNNVFDLAHDLVNISSLGIKDFEDCKHGPFVALFFLLLIVIALFFVIATIVVLIFGLFVVLLEVVVHFVDGIIR